VASESEKCNSDIDEPRQSTSESVTTRLPPTHKKRQSTAAAASGDDLSKMIKQISQYVIGLVDQTNNESRSENDEYYTFAMMIYSLMKDMKPGPACDMCCIKIQLLIMEYKYLQP
jgi:hypothetical protein